MSAGKPTPEVRFLYSPPKILLKMERFKIVVLCLVAFLLIAAALVWRGFIWVIAAMLAMFTILLIWSYIMANDDDFFDDLF